MIGVGQADFQVGEPQANRAAIAGLLEIAGAAGVEILVLPELANSGYMFFTSEEARRGAEPVPGGPVCDLLAGWSRGGRLVACGLCEDAGEQLYNSAAVFADGALAAVYRKAHLFLNEPDFFAPGDAPPPLVTFRGWQVGLMICFDWAFPEMARMLALDGAQILLHPSNLVLPYAQQAMLVRSIENRVFTATANRFGEERGTRFSGCSQITAPDGSRLAQAGAADYGVVCADVDLREADNKRITPRNHLLRDRRPELYRRLTASPDETNR